ncbi:hypothetical protein B0H10DRAFT_2000583, partial [Mycena sp. CBHHK59/15]
MHDWDYSKFTEDGWKRFQLLHPDVTEEEIDKELKDMTVSDIVLSASSLVLEMLHQIRDPSLPCRHTYKHDLESFYWLLLWILLRHAKHLDLVVQSPAPFSFDEALSSPGWPENDPALPFTLSSTEQALVKPVAPHTSSFSMSSNSAAKCSKGLRPGSSARALEVGEAGSSSGSGHKRKRDAADEEDDCGDDDCEDDDEDDEEADDEEDAVGYSVAYVIERGDRRRGHPRH